MKHFGFLLPMVTSTKGEASPPPQKKTIDRKHNPIGPIVSKGSIDILKKMFYSCKIFGEI